MLTYAEHPFELDRGDATLCGAVHDRTPTMVLLHAGRENRHVWDPVIADVQRRFPLRCLTLDQRGHGESSGDRNRFRPIVDDLRDLLGRIPGPTMLVGCSLGGLAAVGAVEDAAVARSVMGIVLVDVVPDLQPDPVWSFLDQAGLLPEAEQIAVEILGVAGSLHRVMERFGGHMALVRAERSAMTPADVERFQRTRPDAAVIDIAGAGHLVARDQPSELATVLTDTAADWLASTPITQVPRNDAMRVAQPDGSSIQGA